MKIKNFVTSFVVFMIFSTQAAVLVNDQIKPKHVVFGLFNVLINFDIDKRVDDFVCNNATEILLTESTGLVPYSADLANRSSEMIQKYKKNRKEYSPTAMVMMFRKSMMMDWYCGVLNSSALFSEFMNNLTQIYSNLEQLIDLPEAESRVCILDKIAIKSCIEIFFGPNREAVVWKNKLKLEDCFSINPHGLALLDYVLDVGIHNVYIVENISMEWALTLANKFRKIFERVYPTFAGLSSLNYIPHDSKCFFSCNAKKGTGFSDFVSAFCLKYGKINPESCVLIAVSDGICNAFRRNNVKAIGFGGMVNFSSNQFKQDSWNKIINTLKNYEVFDRARSYSYHIPQEYFEN